MPAEHVGIRVAEDHAVRLGDDWHEDIGGQQLAFLFREHLELGRHQGGRVWCCRPWAALGSVTLPDGTEP